MARLQRLPIGSKQQLEDARAFKKPRVMIAVHQTLSRSILERFLLPLRSPLPDHRKINKQADGQPARFPLRPFGLLLDSGT
jgi:hypothetical protein